MGNKLKYIVHFVIFWILLWGVTKAQNTPLDVITTEVTGKDKPNKPDSRNGRVLTPQGHIHLLVVFAGFTNDLQNGAPYSDSEIWPPVTRAQGDKALPVWADSLFYKKVTDFSMQNRDFSLSNFYYQMSAQSPDPFMITADVYPERINVTATDALHARGGYTAYTRMVWEHIAANNRIRNYSIFDRRKNNPSFRFNNAESEKDSYVDYMIIIWRSDGTHEPYGTKGLVKQAGSSGGYDGIAPFDGKYFKIKNGFTITLGLKPFPEVAGVFRHEFAHALFNCPHFFGSNGMIGPYFYLNYGWGMICSLYRPFNSCNGWERWFVGWTGLQTKNNTNLDIRSAADLPKDGVIRLRDFITTGEVLRLKLPLPDTNNRQYLWLENHQGISIFDERDYWKVDGVGNRLPKPPRGVMAYVEGITDDFNQTNILNAKRGAMRVIHPEGNYDYSFSTKPFIPKLEEQFDPVNGNYNPKSWWGNIIYNFKKGAENPISGLNSAVAIRGDFDAPKGEITIRDDNMNTGRGNETYEMLMQDGKMIYGAFGEQLGFPASKKIGIGSNPVIPQLRVYSKSDTALQGYHLNGLSFEILEYEADGTAKIRVQYNDLVIGNNYFGKRREKKLRWTGNIVLTDLTHSPDPDLEIKDEVQVILDKSQTPDRHIELGKGSGDFSNPSQLEVSENSKIIIHAGSGLHLKNDSRIILQKGAKIIVMPGATLSLQALSQIVLREEAEIELLAKARFDMGKKTRMIIHNRGTLSISKSAITQYNKRNIINHSSKSNNSQKEIKVLHERKLKKDFK